MPENELKLRCKRVYSDQYNDNKRRFDEQIWIVSSDEKDIENWSTNICIDKLPFGNTEQIGIFIELDMYQLQMLNTILSEIIKQKQIELNLIKQS